MMELLRYLNKANGRVFQDTTLPDAPGGCWQLTKRLLIALFSSTALVNMAWSAVIEMPLVLVTSSPQELTAAVGERLEDIGVTIEDIVLRGENAARVQWRIEPSDAARLETASTTYFSQASGYTLASTSVTVLKAGTFHIIAGGLYDLQDSDPSDISQARAVPTLAGNEIAFTVTADAIDSGAEPSGLSQPAELSNNQLQARDTLQSACASIQAVGQELPSAQQTNLLAACASVQQLADPAVALNRIAAEELFAMGDAIVETAQSQTGNLYARINSVRSGQQPHIDVSGLSVKVSGETIEGRILSARRTEPDGVNGGAASNDAINDTALGYFANGSLSLGSVRGDGLQRDADISSQRFTFGADYRINNNIVIGTGIGLVDNDTDFKGDNGALGTRGLNFSVFGTWYESDQGYADVILDFGRNSFDLERRVNLPGEVDEFAAGSTTADLITLAISAARTFNTGSWAFGPTMRLNITGASVDSFQEQSTLGTNASGSTLNIEKHSVKSIRMAIGADISRVINTRIAVLVPVFRAEYELESENDKGDIQATFVHDPASTPMRFTGTARDKSYLNLTIGTTAVFAKNTSAFVFYETRAQNDVVSQKWLKTGLRLRF